MESKSLRQKKSSASAHFHAACDNHIGNVSTQLLFSPEDGRIWFGNKRLVMWECSTLGALRRELIASVGQEQVRSLLTRVAYGSGSEDAEQIMKLHQHGSLSDTFALGVQTLRLAGLIQPEHNRFEFDLTQGRFFAELSLKDSHEADEHIAAFGVGNEPTCWMQVGYASGYASAFMGKMILYREVECKSQGADRCRFVGRPADEWDELDQDLPYFQPDTSAKNIQRAYQELQKKSDHVHPKSDGHDALSPTENLIGISTSFSTARHLIERVASTQATVLFTGASGVGKERFAQTLHEISPRSNGPFIAINCAAIPDTLIESELFGVERGAFTGASTSRAGRFERAEGGTLFLDEIASLSFVAQGKLLRALQERKIERVGGTKLISVNVRVVAATNIDLRDEVKAGRFREDLFFRLNVFPINLPPLKERRDDIPLLMDAFLKHFCKLYERQVSGFTPKALHTLLNYDYPGNVRELQNLIERGVIMAEPQQAIDVHHLFRGGENIQNTHIFSVNALGRLSSDSHDSQESLSQNFGHLSPLERETEHYRNALIAAKYNIAEAARHLGLTRAQFAYRLKRLNLA